jgi:pSer/pThr/pTyr-binding forkhead associated (FHA) protein
MGEAMAYPSELKAQIETERRGLPFLVYRDAEERQRIFELGERAQSVTIGRGSTSDVSLEWDEEVSWVHAELERVGDAWTVVDDGLSRNGTHLNGERLSGRRRLRDGDSFRVGGTSLLFREPLQRKAGVTVVTPGTEAQARLSDAQRRVLVALCRPFKDGDAYASPPPNQQIADELFLGVDTVKTHLRALFARFEIEDLPQNQKRLKLVEIALRSGVVSRREL